MSPVMNTSSTDINLYKGAWAEVYNKVPEVRIFTPTGTTKFILLKGEQLVELERFMGNADRSVDLGDGVEADWNRYNKLTLSKGLISIKLSVTDIGVILTLVWGLNGHHFTRRRSFGV
jgi:hypothetical protein